MNWEPRVFIVTVPTPGTPVSGAAVFTGNSQFTPKVIISAQIGNTNPVFYGGSNIDATHRKPMNGGQADELTAPYGLHDVFDLSTFRFDATTANEGFEVTIFIPAS